MASSIGYRSAADFNRRSLKAFAAFCLIASLAACSSSKPRLGDTIKNQGAELAAIGDQWSKADDMIEDGREQIDDGQDMIGKGNKLINKGESLVEKGRNNVKSGQEMKQRAESTYRQRTGQELPVN